MLERWPSTTATTPRCGDHRSPRRRLERPPPGRERRRRQAAHDARPQASARGRHLPAHRRTGLRLAQRRERDRAVGLGLRVPLEEPAVELVSSSPRCCSVTVWAPSMSTRYWYQDRSQATVTTTSRWLRCTTLTLGSPSVRAMPETVRGCVLSLNSSRLASTASAGSSGSSSGSNGSGAVRCRLRGRRTSADALLAARASCTGSAGAPSRIQPRASASSTHSSHTSASSSPIRR